LRREGVGWALEEEEEEGGSVLVDSSRESCRSAAAGRIGKGMSERSEQRGRLLTLKSSSYPSLTMMSNSSIGTRVPPPLAIRIIPFLPLAQLDPRDDDAC
jgi:hypothetical protein